MKFPVSWIREYVSIKLSDHELAELLTSIGFAVEAMEEVEGECVFEIDVTTNRPDCMNVFGCAREVAAATGAKLKEIKSRYREEKTSSSQLFSVEIDDAALCPRYSGKVIQNVVIAPSPPSLAKRIVQIGLRPVNNVVDASNYVLFELGHPIHIFDLSKLDGRKIIVRTAHRGEKIITIDGIERTLTDDMLVIADQNNPVAVAGVMGGMLSEVSNSTTDLFIESAYFDPQSIRTTSKKLGLSTDASFRFERGADFDATLKAIDRVTSIIAEFTKGKIASGSIDVVRKIPSRKEIFVRMKRVELLLGVTVTQKRATEILRSLGMKVIAQGNGILKVVIPAFRVDIDREVDCIEEIARFIKYDSLPCTIPYATDQKRKAKPDRRDEFARSLFAAFGCSETINYSMISTEEDSSFSFYRAQDPLAINNPLSEKVSLLRRSLLPGLFKNIASNFSRGLRDLKLFEIGKVYHLSDRGEPEERKHAALAITGAVGEEHWSKQKRDSDLWDIKGATEVLLEKFGCDFSLAEPDDQMFFMKEMSFQLVSQDGKRIAVGGKIETVLQNTHKVSQPVWMTEISLSEISRVAEQPRSRPVSPLPVIRRDISVIVPDEVKYSDISRLLREKWRDPSVSVVLANRYSGDPIPQGKTSLMFSLFIHQSEKTLTNSEINVILDRLFHILSDGVGANLRKE